MTNLWRSAKLRGMWMFNVQRLYLRGGGGKDRTGHVKVKILHTIQYNTIGERGVVIDFIYSIQDRLLFILGINKEEDIVLALNSQFSWRHR